MIPDNVVEVTGGLTLKDRYRLFRRAGGVYYVRDTATMRKQSLETTDLAQARRLLAAKNQAAEQPALNKSMAKAYLSATSPEFTTRTWVDVMERYVHSGVESTRERKERAFKSRPFALLRKVKLIDTEAIHLFAVLEHQKAGNSTHHYMRRLHNFALHLGWLLSPIMANAAWPLVRRKKFTAITEDEHKQILAREQNLERKHYFEMLWETGGAQSDIANLHRDRVDMQEMAIRFSRQKLAGQNEGRGGGETYLCLSSKMIELLKELPAEGYLFPNLRKQEAKDRAGYFRKACRSCHIKGRTLHSYRYAWAQRAKAAGVPERDAMNHLGHKSSAIHAVYSDDARVKVLPLEFYEAQKKAKIVQFSSSLVEPNNSEQKQQSAVRQSS